MVIVLKKKRTKLMGSLFQLFRISLVIVKSGVRLVDILRDLATNVLN